MSSKEEIEVHKAIVKDFHRKSKCMAMKLRTYPNVNFTMNCTTFNN